MKHEVQSDVYLSVVTDVGILTEGGWTKTTPDKTPWTKTPRTIQREFVQGAFVPVLCTRPTKNLGGSEMCDVLSGGPGMCDKV